MSQGGEEREMKHTLAFHAEGKKNWIHIMFHFSGTIQSFNIRGKRPDMQSEVYEGEFSGMASVLKNSKLVVGCGDGKTYMFNWGQFGYHSAGKAVSCKCYSFL